MKGLLLKDLYNIRKQAWWYLSMILLFCLLSVTVQNIAFAGTIGVLVTVSVPLIAIGYEEKDSWQKFVVASGRDIKTIVAEKYLLGIICAVTGFVAYAVVYLLSERTSLTDLFVPLFMQITVLSVMLPTVFKFGVDKGRVYMIAVILIFMLAFIGLLSAADKFVGTDLIIFNLTTAVLIAGVLVISYFISLKIYTAKEF